MPSGEVKPVTTERDETRALVRCGSRSVNEERPSLTGIRRGHKTRETKQADARSTNRYSIIGAVTWCGDRAVSLSPERHPAAAIEIRATPRAGAMRGRNLPRR